MPHFKESVGKCERLDRGNWYAELQSDSRIILGDMENAVCINSMILLTKKVIYNAMKKEQKPHIAQVKNEVKKFYFEEKYRQYVQGKGRLFDKQYILLNNFYAT